MPQRQHPSRDTGATYYKTDLVLVAVGQRFKAPAVRLALPPNRAQPSAVLRRHISPAKQRALGAGVARARSATAEEPGRCSTSDAQARRPRVCRRAKACGSGSPALVRAPSQTPVAHSPASARPHTRARRARALPQTCPCPRARPVACVDTVSGAAEAQTP